jgi:hypothetical protein
MDATTATSDLALNAAQWIVEVALGLYVLDLITGLVHMHLDYQEVKSRDLRLHVENNIPDVIQFEETDPLFYNATPNDQYLWNFHVHHDAPYPSKDSEWELTMQVVRPLAMPYLLSVLLCYMGYMNASFARIWFGALTAGPLVRTIKRVFFTLITFVMWMMSALRARARSRVGGGCGGKHLKAPLCLRPPALRYPARLLCFCDLYIRCKRRTSLPTRETTRSSRAKPGAAPSSARSKTAGCS